MTSYRVRGTVAWSAALLVGVLAAGSNAAADVYPSRLSCAFDAGTGGSFDGKAFVKDTPRALSFTIRDINLKAQNAGLETAQGKAAGHAMIVRALNANHFIEAVTEGFMNITTVYDSEDGGASEQMPAVHSRHFGVLGQAVYAQYTGFCTKSEPAKSAAAAAAAK